MKCILIAAGYDDNFEFPAKIERNPKLDNYFLKRLRNESIPFSYILRSFWGDPCFMRSSLFRTSCVCGSAFSKARDCFLHRMRLSRMSFLSSKNSTKFSFSKARSRSSTNCDTKKCRMQRGTVSHTFILSTLKHRTTFLFTFFISSCS